MARKEKKIHYIYKTTCNVTGKWYVGLHSTYNLDDGYMGSGTILRHSIRKHGVQQHTKEILEFLPTREELVLKEIEIITKELISDGKCMNLKEGGYGGFANEEHRVKCSKAGNKAFKEKLENDEDFFIKFSKQKSEVTKKTHADGKLTAPDWTGKNHSEETKQLMSEKKKGLGVGETNSQFGTCWITKDGTNKKIKKEDFETYLNEGWLKGRK
jgi:hypothetical protein